MTSSIDRDGGAQGAPVPGLRNLRDAGAGTGHVAAGLLLRSESPAALGVDDAAALLALDVDLMIDLRSERESAADPYSFDGATRLALPIELLDPAEALDADLSLEVLYERLVDQHGATLAGAIRAIADHDGGAVLVHCTAGKDRTGVVIALVLLLLGVDRAQVLADYAATHANLRGPWTEAFLARAGVEELPAHLLEILNGSPAPVLDRVIDRIEAAHGGIEPYLRGHGLDDGDLAALRARLLTASTIQLGAS